MHGGWFVGNFQPSAYRTGNCEVAVKHHRRHEPWPAHYHALATEITLLLKGRLYLNQQLIRPGTIVVVEPGEVVTPTFADACDVVVVKVPSLPGDKYVL